MATSKKPKPITLRYTINGTKFKRRFLPTQHADAEVRVEVLRENGIEVKVTGWPKKVTWLIPPLAGK